MSQPAAAKEAPKRNQFGTFGGVYTPSLLTILGVIMFMRTGYVTGQAGILYAIIILVIANSITFLTSLSISGISTNTKVKGGGAYFLISRSLGPEFGGAIGLTLFFAQALSVPFYILGFVEALVRVFPVFTPYFLPIGLITAVLLFVVNYVGADWAIKAQFAILGVLVLSVLVLIGGAIAHFDVATFQENQTPVYDEPGLGFWPVFAVFFPAVTGIMAGVNMSGDLKDPAKSLPSGTLAAVATGFVVYFAQILLTGGAQTRSQLVDAPYESLLSQALFNLDFLIVAGVFAATISSALGSLLGAPRILQALSRDGIFPVLQPFSHGTAKGDEPRRGLWLTFVMTLIVLALTGGGEPGAGLNAVAVVLTMFFLFAYGMTNMAAFIERFGGNPSFRPRFKFFHWWTALLGAVGCFATSLLINLVAAVVAFGVVVLLFLYVRRRVLSTSFGDARRGFYYSRVKANLQLLQQHPANPKNWRPTTLVLSGNPENRTTLTHYAALIGSSRGIVTLAQILKGDCFAMAKERREAKGALERFISENDLNAFPEVIVSPDVDMGMASLVQAHSIGPLKPNLVVLGWSARIERAPAFFRHLHHISDLGMSEVVVVDRGLPTIRARRIDVWWRGQRNGSLMVILAYLISLNPGWTRALIRVLRLVNNEDEVEAAEKEILDLSEAARIDVETKIICHDTFKHALHEHSRDASVLLLGFRSPEDESTAKRVHEAYDSLLEEMPTTLLVSSSGDADVFA